MFQRPNLHDAMLDLIESLIPPRFDAALGIAGMAIPASFVRVHDEIDYITRRFEHVEITRDTTLFISDSIG